MQSAEWPGYERAGSTNQNEAVRSADYQILRGAFQRRHEQDSLQTTASVGNIGWSQLPSCMPGEVKAHVHLEMGDVLEEADESAYWVELLTDSGKVDPKLAAPVLSEANELVAISISSINTARRNAVSEE